MDCEFGAGKRELTILGIQECICIFDNRVGMARSYAKLDGALDFDDYMAELKNGRSYVSDGKSHIIDFHVDFEFRSRLLQGIIGLFFHEAVLGAPRHPWPGVPGMIPLPVTGTTIGIFSPNFSPVPIFFGPPPQNEENPEAA